MTTAGGSWWCHNAAVDLIVAWTAYGRHWWALRALTTVIFLFGRKLYQTFFSLTIKLRATKNNLLHQLKSGLDLASNEGEMVPQTHFKSLVQTTNHLLVIIYLKMFWQIFFLNFAYKGARCKTGVPLLLCVECMEFLLIWKTVLTATNEKMNKKENKTHICSCWICSTAVVCLLINNVYICQTKLFQCQNKYIYLMNYSVSFPVYLCCLLQEHPHGHGSGVHGHMHITVVIHLLQPWITSWIFFKCLQNAHLLVKKLFWIGLILIRERLQLLGRVWWIRG